MGLDAIGRRRRFGVIILLAAVGMLIGGETFLKGQLSGVGFLVYWLLCFVFTGMAIVVAYVDARAVQRRTRREARELLETTLTRIETDAKKKPGRLRAGDEHQVRESDL
jgi:membrane protein implicated in regulation of membrane protease activity